MKKIKYTSGCICTAYLVDDENFIDLPLQERYELALKLAELTNNVLVFQCIYNFYLDYTMLSPDMTDAECDIATAKIDYNMDLFERLWTLDEQKKTCIGFIKETWETMDEVDKVWFYQYVFEIVLKYDGKHEDLGYCECCGDSIDSYELII